jgi:hypothetical protein
VLGGQTPTTDFQQKRQRGGPRYRPADRRPDREPRGSGPGRLRQCPYAASAQVSELASGSQESFEERTVALEGVSEVVGGDVVTSVPVALQPSPLIGEGPGQVLHQLGHQGVGLLDRPPWGVDEPGLDVGPAGPESLGILGGQQ